MPSRLLWTLILALVIMSAPAHAQERTGLAATLEVLNAGVEVLRVGTSNWIAVNLESIIGTGDTIRTNETGRARVTFFADGTVTEILPSTEYRILNFEGAPRSFRLTLELVVGQTLQTLGRALDAASEYNVMTPAMTLSARGTTFAIRVLEGGRSAMLVREGVVDVASEREQAQVPQAFGIRGEADGTLSNVIPATTFEQLDAAIDGCDGTVTNPDDISFNLRAEPDSAAELLAVVLPADITRLYAVTQSTGWYLVQLDSHRGWIRANAVSIVSDCAGLRVLPDSGIDDTVAPDALPTSP
jgi:hypothetical protein